MKIGLKLRILRCFFTFFSQIFGNLLNFGCVCLMGVRAVICLSLFIFYIFREYPVGVFYHCVSIVISFNSISLVIHFIVELMFI